MCVPLPRSALSCGTGRLSAPQTLSPWPEGRVRMKEGRRKEKRKGMMQMKGKLRTHRSFRKSAPMTSNDLERRNGVSMSFLRQRFVNSTRAVSEVVCMYVFIRQRTIQQRHCKNSSRQDSQAIKRLRLPYQSKPYIVCG